MVGYDIGPIHLRDWSDVGSRERAHIYVRAYAFAPKAAAKVTFFFELYKFIHKISQFFSFLHQILAYSKKKQ